MPWQVWPGQERAAAFPAGPAMPTVLPPHVGQPLATVVREGGPTAHALPSSGICLPQIDISSTGAIRAWAHVDRGPSRDPLSL